MIKISCPQCKSILEFEHSASGSQRFCSSCGLSLIIPIIESQDHAKDSETDSEKFKPSMSLSKISLKRVRNKLKRS